MFNQHDFDVLEANILRSMSLMSKSWDTDDISVSEMTAQIEALCEVVNGDSDFGQFAKSTNLTGRERLN